MQSNLVPMRAEFGIMVVVPAIDVLRPRYRLDRFLNRKNESNTPGSYVLLDACIEDVHNFLVAQLS